MAPTKNIANAQLWANSRIDVDILVAYSLLMARKLLFFKSTAVLHHDCPVNREERPKILPNSNQSSLKTVFGLSSLITIYFTQLSKITRICYKEPYFSNIVTAKRLRFAKTCQCDDIQAYTYSSLTDYSFLLHHYLRKNLFEQRVFGSFYLTQRTDLLKKYAFCLHNLQYYIIDP